MDAGFTGPGARDAGLGKQVLAAELHCRLVTARQSELKKAAASHELAHSVVVCSHLDTPLPIP